MPLEISDGQGDCCVLLVKNETVQFTYAILRPALYI